MNGIEQSLAAALPPDRSKRDHPLALYTTFRVGGPADWLVEPRSKEELLQVLELARAHQTSVTMLGGGSNVLVSDHGVRGMVIRPRGGDVERINADEIRAGAAVTINGLVRWTISHAMAGLEAWAGTPGTVAGAIVGNAHFGGRLIGDLVTAVEVWSPTGGLQEVPAADMKFGYDRSRVQQSGEVVVSARFAVGEGHRTALRAVARESLAFRKRTQPLDTPSAGCIFQNPQRGIDLVPAGVPWSAGALVDRAGLKTASEGGAQVSAGHGNFIVNQGRATAREIRRLIERCREAVHREFGVLLRDEIVYLGDFTE